MRSLQAGMLQDQHSALWQLNSRLNNHDDNHFSLLYHHLSFLIQLHLQFLGDVRNQMKPFSVYFELIFYTVPFWQQGMSHLHVNTLLHQG
jgi:hypothetical protein